MSDARIVSKYAMLCFSTSFVFAEVLEVADRDVGVVLCCNLGGQLEPRSQEPGLVGIQSRSLVAAYELMNAGFKEIKVLDKGVNGWREAGRDLYVEETGDEAAE